MALPWLSLATWHQTAIRPLLQGRLHRSNTCFWWPMVTPFVAWKKCGICVLVTSCHKPEHWNGVEIQMSFQTSEGEKHQPCAEESVFRFDQIRSNKYDCVINSTIVNIHIYQKGAIYGWYRGVPENLVFQIPNKSHIIYHHFPAICHFFWGCEEHWTACLAVSGVSGQARAGKKPPHSACQERPIHGDVWENTWLVCGFYMGIVCLWVLYGLDMAFHMAFIWLSYGFLNGSYMVSLWVLNGCVIMCIYIYSFTWLLYGFTWLSCGFIKSYMVLNLNCSYMLIWFYMCYVVLYAIIWGVILLLYAFYIVLLWIPWWFNQQKWRLGIKPTKYEWDLTGI